MDLKEFFKIEPIVLILGIHGHGAYFKDVAGPSIK
jgi:hypothetical protein